MELHAFDPERIGCYEQDLTLARPEQPAVRRRLRPRLTISTIRYMDRPTRASALLRQARLAAGLTQSQLAALADTSQSAIAAYEGGQREPTLPVLERMLRASGHHLVLGLEADEHLFNLSDLALALQASDERHRLRLVFEFLRGAADDGYPPLLLVASEPPLIGDPRFDALLAAIAEDLCVRAGVVPPPWVHKRERFLDGFWWVSDLPSARARALVHAPASFRRRGVMLDRHDLVAA
jgi:transcriptional regulator with XRE-family HTH domain